MNAHRHSLLKISAATVVWTFGVALFADEVTPPSEVSTTDSKEASSAPPIEAQPEAELSGHSPKAQSTQVARPSGENPFAVVRERSASSPTSQNTSESKAADEKIAPSTEKKASPSSDKTKAPSTNKQATAQTDKKAAEKPTDRRAWRRDKTVRRRPGS